MVWSGIVWVVAGLFVGVVMRAVSPADQAPAFGPTLGLGAVGGLVGGAVIAFLGRQQLAGFATGLIGSFMGALVLLTAWGVMARPAHRHA